MNFLRRWRASRSVVAQAAVWSLAVHAAAAPVALSTAPAGTVAKPPAPNVIVTLDDSGSMAGDSMATLKAALNAAFTASNLPDGAIRLGWNAMNRCTTIPSSTGGCNGLNGVRVLDSTHRSNFLDWVNRNEGTFPVGLHASGNTPTHQAYIAAADHYRLSSVKDVLGPWASIPGSTLQPVLSCRKSYSLLMTDGGWNHGVVGDAVTRGGGNADGAVLTLPDGTVYDTSSPSTRIFRDAWGGALVNGGTLSTMADLAFYYWATDLTGLAKKVSPRIRHSGAETFTSGSTSVSLPEYWNPRNDPATWQHMTTYTIGFRDAAAWPTTGTDYGSYPAWGGDTYAGSFPALVTGTQGWPDPVGPSPFIGGVYNQSRKTELWHMAINSRGKFIPARTSQDLVNAFKDIIDDILQDPATPTTSLAGSSRSTRQGSAAFSAGFRAKDWSGHVRRDELQPGMAAVGTQASQWKWGAITDGTPPTTRSKTTADLMDEQDAAWPEHRLVLSHKTEPTAGGAPVSSAIPWVWSSLSAAQKTALRTVGGILDTSTTADATAQDRMAYVRGDRRREQSAATPGPFRNRGSRQGDIVNSRLWYLDGQPASGYTHNDYAAFRSSRSARPPMLYVGGNDGMLHAFDAASGVERLAYIPEGLHAALPELTQPAYVHRYYVDGSPLSGDWWNGSAWKTALAGSLGAGGKGYFVLDVTDPAQFSVANASAIVWMDKTGAVDADVGHIMSEPVTERSDPGISRQITRMNDGRWALVMGNGYNSSSEKAMLLIQYLDGARELLKIAADNAGNNGNGLSAPRLVDLNGDNVPDVAYAGDLRGNLWKFDLSSATAGNWKVALSGSPLYAAMDAAETPARQPITSAPVYVAHPKGGLMVVFGTGRTLSDADRASTQTQTVYGIHDNTAIAVKEGPTLGAVSLATGAGAAVSDGRASLVRQTIGTAAVGRTTDTASAVYGVSSNPIENGDGTPRRGWYLDLPVSRERVTDNLRWFDGDLVDIRSTIPAIGTDPNVETCEASTAGGQAYLTTLNAINGNAPNSQIYAYDAGAGGTANGSRVLTGLDLRLRDDAREQPYAAPGTPKPPARRLLGKLFLRPSWRQVQ
ncbi:PilC/PilY family type IV pilus protein [Xenophilus aerolatus]|nr:PilC/PilY family type IV pilus protein [Xenophilus aerolatus]